MGLEPTTPCLQSRCSSQLSYVPWLVLRRTASTRSFRVAIPPAAVWSWPYGSKTLGKAGGNSPVWGNRRRKPTLSIVAPDGYVPGEASWSRARTDKAHSTGTGETLSGGGRSTPPVPPPDLPCARRAREGVTGATTIRPQRRGEHGGRVEILHRQLRSHEEGAVGLVVRRRLVSVQAASSYARRDAKRHLDARSARRVSDGGGPATGTATHAGGIACPTAGVPASLAGPRSRWEGPPA